MHLSEYARAAKQATADTDEPLTLIRVGSAILYRRGSLALRVTGPDVDAADVQMEARLARWLNEQHVRAVDVEHVHQHGQMTVSVMRWIEQTRPASASDAATIAAAMHQLPAPAWLRSFDPLAQTRTRTRRLTRDQTLCERERRTVESGLARAHDAWDTARRQASGVVHGDLTADNVLVGGDVPAAHDFENAGAGPALWDLVRPWHAATRFADTGACDEFLATYTSARGAAPDHAALEQLSCIVDVIGAVWCVAGRQLDPARYADEADVRLETVATRARSGATWTAR